MGNKVNPIALRIGEQVNWFNWWELKNNNREDLLDYLIINTTIENILKKNNIFVSELIVKKNNREIMGSTHILEEWNNDYEVWNTDIESNKEIRLSEQTNKENIDYIVSGVVYRSNTLGKEERKKDNWNKYIEELNNTERKSLKGKNLLLESYILIEKILEEWLDKRIKIDLKEISGAVFNAKILSSWVEKSMWEDKYGLNDKKIMNIMREHKESNK